MQCFGAMIMNILFVQVTAGTMPAVMTLGSPPLADRSAPDLSLLDIDALPAYHVSRQIIR